MPATVETVMAQEAVEAIRVQYRSERRGLAPSVQGILASVVYFAIALIVLIPILVTQAADLGGDRLRDQDGPPVLGIRMTFDECRRP